MRKHIVSDILKIVQKRTVSEKRGEQTIMRHKLIECRGKKSRQEVAYDLDITRQMLGALERGDRTPSLSLARKISVYYGIPIDVIFFNEHGHKMFP